jgi:membrane protease YdiL (CAAX protease family)
MPSLRRRALGGLLFLIGSLVAMLFAGVSVSVALLAQSNGATPSARDLPPGLLACGALIQFAGMAATAGAVAAWIGRGSHAFALERPSAWVWPVAVCGGATVGVFPGWLAWYLTEHFHEIDLGNIDRIQSMVQSSSSAERVVAGLGLVVVAPLVEELCFRGLIFDLLHGERAGVAAWVGSSLLFAAYHFDPIQSTAITLTGLFLGWLRWRSGSVWPGIVAHAINNGLAMGLLLTSENGAALGFVASVGVGLVTVVLSLGLLLVPQRQTDG